MAHRAFEDVAIAGVSGALGPLATSRSLLRRWRLRLLVAVAVVLLLPVPWQHKADSGLGLAWGLDNRLVVEGQRLDPAGQYSWLTAGRPALVGEVAWNRRSMPTPRPRSQTSDRVRSPHVPCTSSRWPQRSAWPPRVSTSP